MFFGGGPLAIILLALGVAILIAGFILSGINEKRKVNIYKFKESWPEKNLSNGSYRDIEGKLFEDARFVFDYSRIDIEIFRHSGSMFPDSDVRRLIDSANSHRAERLASPEDELIPAVRTIVLDWCAAVEGYRNDLGLDWLQKLEGDRE